MWIVGFSNRQIAGGFGGFGISRAEGEKIPIAHRRPSIELTMSAFGALRHNMRGAAFGKTGSEQPFEFT